MRQPLLAVVAFALLSGCGTHMSPMAGHALAPNAFAAAEAKKKAIDPPAPLPPRQAFSAGDAAAIATQAYAEAFATKDPKACQQVAETALEKMAALVPSSDLAKQIVPFAKAALKTNTTDPENARRLALWPMLYISKGLTNANDPTFFEMTAKLMQSMLNFKDGLQVGMTTLNYLEDSPNGYVKTMVAKAFATFRNPKVDTQATYKTTLATLEEIGQTLAATKK